MLTKLLQSACRACPPAMPALPALSEQSESKGASKASRREQVELSDSNGPALSERSESKGVMGDELGVTFAAIALDALGVSVVIFDSTGEPVFISSRCAEMFALRDRKLLRENRAILESLSRLALAELKREQAHGSADQRSVDEIILKTSDNREFTALAETRAIDFSAAGSPVAGAAVVLHELAALEPYFELSAQIRRLRRPLVLLSSLVGGPPDALSFEDLMSAFEEQKAPADKAASLGRGKFSDLSECLTLAVEIVDRLSVQTFKISVDASTSVLVQLDRQALSQLLSHLLLESADFAGPFGRARVALNLTRKGGSADFAQLLLFVQRGETSTSDAFQRFIVHKSMPATYKITRGFESSGSSSSSAASADSTSDEETFFEKMLEREGSSLKFSSATLITEQSFGENLRIAARIADDNASMLAAKRLGSNFLAITLTLPLLT